MQTLHNHRFDFGINLGVDASQDFTEAAWHFSPAIYNPPGPPRLPTDGQTDRWTAASGALSQECNLEEGLRATPPLPPLSPPPQPHNAAEVGAEPQGGAAAPTPPCLTLGQLCSPPRRSPTTNKTKWKRISKMINYGGKSETSRVRQHRRDLADCGAFCVTDVVTE